MKRKISLVFRVSKVNWIHLETIGLRIIWYGRTASPFFIPDGPMDKNGEISKEDTFIVIHHKIRDIFFLRFLNRRSSIPSSTAAKSFRLIIAISFSSKVSTGQSIPDIDNIYLRIYVLSYIQCVI
ncbi:hypothetical protein V1478_005938 [Vespula squamosa]|uniref:Uncharacterized protein n=1 Tax=Vespula squamosa TaxID=30214 RepID=A0ABD2BAU2_VESSQ